jgi:arylsulfatase A-like enzyme/Tfp pilus assembly protein PilF
LIVTGLLAVCITVAGIVLAFRQPHPSAGPNVLLITIDTLRADRVGRGLTPAIDGLASRGLAFTNARTVAPLTLPAHVSLMTGLFPPAHGVRENGTYRFDARHPTLARLLREAGYRTAAFVAAYVLDRRFGLNDGFDLYDDQIRRDPDAVARLDAERPGNIVADRAIAWLRALGDAPGSRVPFFLWIHFYDPHAPYNPPPQFLEKAHGQAYDGEVAFADAQLGRVLAALDEIGRMSSTVVVVAGDHGESLGEHGERTHGMLLFEPALRVPLVVAGPGVAPGVRQQAVSAVDVAPTILRLLGRPVPGQMSGVDLRTGGQPVSRATGNTTDVYSETQYPRAAGWSPVFSLVSDRWKLVQSSGMKLFDLKGDPGEQHDVAAGHEALVRSLAARVAAIRASEGTAGARRERPTAEVAERLRALGYVAATTENPVESGAADPATVIDAWNQFEDAENAMTARQYPRALSLLEALVAAHPNAPVFESTLVQALQASGDVRAALDLARRGVARRPRDAALFHALAIAARDARQLNEAMRAEEAALALDPADPTVHNGIGLLDVDLGQPAEAAAAFERAVGIDPTNAQYWTNLGNARRAVGATAAAEQAYRRALEIEPRSTDAANGLGVLLVQGGRPAEAIPWFERALSGTTDFYEAWLNLGIACQQAGDVARAAQAYREVLRAPARFAREREGARKLLDGLGHRSEDRRSHR